MARYFMGDARLGWLEKMMMASPTRTALQQKRPQKKPRNRPVKPQRKEGT